MRCAVIFYCLGNIGFPSSYDFIKNEQNFCMYYNYHARNLQRIANGELVGIEKSDKKEFAFVLVFQTPPHTRPIRHHATFRYEKILRDKNIYPPNR